ncbi:MAG: caspase family protein [Sphingobacteriales bacterium]|nr:caspase family protein [Sphingobacteriales bacterium]
MKKSTLILVILVCAFITANSQTPLSFRDTSIKGPQTFAMIMGISKYKYVRPLNYADKDAELFRDYLKSPGGGSVKDNNIFCLLNDKAISSNFWSKGFQWLKAKNLQKADKLFIYLAGHGDAIDEDQFFFLGYDCNPQGDKNNYLVAGTIQLYNLKKKIAVEAGKGVDVIFVMDACRTNELPGGTEGQNFLNTAISEKKAGEIIMLATAAGEESLEDASIGNGHGLFTWYLIDGLTGSADSISSLDYKVTYEEIRNYVDNNVPAIAEQRFNRKQDPYFCCDEKSSKVISSVDTAYLKKWLKQKKAQKGPGNSFTGNPERTFHHFIADTTLIETYNLFNRAVSNKNISGNNSAEYYYQQMERKYHGNPYTLDAKSTLAVEYINDAQKKVDRYLACGDDGSAREKQENYEAALKLQKAIELVSEDDPDYAKALMNRVYFLRASGDLGKDGKNGDISIAFQNAYAALKIDPNGAYIQNKLALLHLQNGNKDSALYYADKATKTAPKWGCALTTLSLVRNAPDNKQPGNNTKQKPKLPGRNSFGVTIGGGLNEAAPTFAGSRNTAFIGVTANQTAAFDIGVIYQTGIGGSVDIRPSVHVSFDGGDLVYERTPTASPQFETITLKNTAVNVSVPFVFRLSRKDIAPFIMLGPSFSYIIKQDAAAQERVPVKKSVVLGEAGIGLDISLTKAGIILSPEIKYSRGLSDQYDDAGTSYTNVLSTLKKQGFAFHLYLRKR